jgi:hypothetical protein
MIFTGRPSALLISFPGKALRVIGHAELFEPVRNLLHCSASCGGHACLGGLDLNPARRPRAFASSAAKADDPTSCLTLHVDLDQTFPAFLGRHFLEHWRGFGRDHGRLRVAPSRCR